MKSKQQDEFQKRRALRRKRIRRRRMIIGVIVIMCLSVVAFVALSLTVLFPVKTVTVSGESRYTDEEIIEASGLNNKDNIFTFSSLKAAECISSQLPYVGDIEIERKLPYSVNIKIKNEKEEFACILSDDRYYAISRDYFVLNVYNECPADLFVIEELGARLKVGEDTEFVDETKQKPLESFIDATEKYDIRVNLINLSSIASLSAVVEGRFEVNFGTFIDIDKKCAHLAGMIKSIEAEKTGKIDVSMWSSESNEGIFTEGAISFSQPKTDENAQNPSENGDSTAKE